MLAAMTGTPGRRLSGRQFHYRTVGKVFGYWRKNFNDFANPGLVTRGLWAQNPKSTGLLLLFSDLRVYPYQVLPCDLQLAPFSPAYRPNSAASAPQNHSHRF